MQKRWGFDQYSVRDNLPEKERFFWEGGGGSRGGGVNLQWSSSSPIVRTYGASKKTAIESFMFVKFISVPDFDLCSLIFAVHFLGVANNSEFIFHTGIFLNFKNGFTAAENKQQMVPLKLCEKQRSSIMKKKFWGLQGLIFYNGS